MTKPIQACFLIKYCQCKTLYFNCSVHACSLPILCSFSLLLAHFTVIYAYLHSSSLWSSLSGVNVEANPCRIRTDDAMLFYGYASREAITVSLDLTDIRYMQCQICIHECTINIFIPWKAPWICNLPCSTLAHKYLVTNVPYGRKFDR